MDGYVELKCTYCGNSERISFIKRDDGYICKCCGLYHYYDNQIDESKVQEISRCNIGMEALKNYSFASAETTFEDIIMDYPRSVEARWGLLQAKYGIVFVKGFFTGEVEPIYCFPSYAYRKGSFFDEKEYAELQGLLRGDPERASLYESMAYDIEAAFDTFREDFGKTENDIFICVKISKTTANNPYAKGNTADYEKARELYEKLKARGKKVFFSFVTLKNKIDSDMQIWENLLKSEKMLLIGSRTEYLNSVWVKSEWQRWLYLDDAEKGRDHRDNLYIYILGNENDDLYSKLPAGLRRLHPQIYTESTEADLINDICASEEIESAEPVKQDDVSQNMEALFAEFLKRINADPSFMQSAVKSQENVPLESAPKQVEIPVSLSKSEPIETSVVRNAPEPEIPKPKSVEKPKAAESVPKADDKTMVRIASESATQKVAADITKNTSKPQEELKIAKDISKADEKADGEILFDDGRKVIIPYGQTIIQSKIYSSNRGIVSVKLPNSVTEVSDSAFEDCRMLTELKLSSNIAKIGRRAFSRCYKLSALYIPESLAKIDECAFSGCSAMRVSISPKNKHYITKNNCLIEKETKTILWGRENSIIPMDGSVKKIGAGAFEACEKLVNVKIPNNITEIGAAAFKACEKLKSVKIPLSVKSIGIFAFLSCPNLTISYSGTEEEWKRLYSAKVNVTCAGKSNNSVNSNESKEEVKPISTNNAKPLPAVEEHTVARSSVEAGSLDGKVVYADGHTEVIPYGTESIADKAYYKKYIESVILPKSVKRIGNDAFGYCYNLKSIDIPEGVTSIGSRAFIWCRYLRNVILPDSLKMLGREVFANCTGLLSIKLSSGLIDIGAYAFNDCNSLASVKIPAGINIIKEGTFEGCKSLAKVELSHKLTEIESKAFSYCDSLASITLPISIKKLGEGVFEESKKVDINYEGTKSLWQTVYHNKVGGELYIRINCKDGGVMA